MLLQSVELALDADTIARLDAGEERWCMRGIEVLAGEGGDPATARYEVHDHALALVRALPRLDEFLDREALEVRNGQAHRSVSYAPASDELIVLDDAGSEKARVSEPDLKRRLSEVFLRARTLQLAYFAAIGKLDTVLVPLSA